ncbi:kelch domain-containing protein 1-like [Pitangus sulphuratus]|nr:kelch domain-containing protein 1-like [Pitangus sulphuratus]
MHLMEGELPTSMSGSCGASINGKLYIFGGFDDKGYSNRLYYVNLRTKTGTYRWKKITNFKGQPPTPRDKLSCWVYKDRLIYFGGYGCRKHNELSDCFDVHDAFWEGQIFWGWHNDVHVFDTTTQTWSQPAIRGHCSDLLIFQTQPYSLLRLCLDCIGKNAALLRNQIPCLPSKLLQEVLKKITFWAAVTHRQERKAETERQSQLNTT